MALENKLNDVEAEADKTRQRLSKSLLVGAPLLITAAYKGMAKGTDISPENLDAIRNMVPMVRYGIVSGMIFGSYAMLKSKLFGTDGRKGGSLVTGGAFKLCRNPYYFGVGSAIGLATGSAVIIDEISRNPSHIPVILTSIGIGIIGKSIHDYVKADEKLLELKFGDEYVHYKERTPRYLPNLLGFFRK